MNERDDDYYAERLRRPSSPMNKVWIGVAVVAFIGVIVLSARQDRRRGREREQIFNPGPMLRPNDGPFAGGPFPVAPPPPRAEDDSPEARQRLIGTFFDRLGEAYRSGDGRRIAALLDERRLAAVIAAEVRRAGGWVGADPGFWERALRLNGGSAWADQAGLIDWRKHEVRQVRSIGPDEVEVVLRIRDRDNTAMTIRWWLCFRDRAWRFHDMEDVDGGVRVSTLIGVLASSDPRQFGKAAAFFPTLRDALLAFRQQDLDGAEKLLQKIDNVEFPVPLERIRLLMKGVIRLGREEVKEAMVLFKKARDLGPRMPVLEYLMASGHNVQGEYEEALVCVDRYADAVGDSAESHYERGYALYGLGRKDEAADSFRASIADGIDMAGSLAQLLRVLPQGQKGEAGELFDRFTSPEDHFEELASQALNEGDNEGVEVLAGVMLRRGTDDPGPWFYHALARARRGLVAEAVREFRQAWPRLREADATFDYHSRFLAAVQLKLSPMEAYAASPDARLAFRDLANSLSEYEDDDGDGDELEQLIHRHRLNDPGDPWIVFQTGRMHEHRGRHDEAEEAYAAAMKLKLTDEDREAVRSARVYNRHRAGRGLTAYDDVEPKEETFEQLAGLFASAHRLEDLEALIAAHRPHQPASVTLPMWDAELKWLNADYEGALKLLRRHHDGVFAAPEHRWRYQDRLVRSLVRLERYREAVREVQGEAADCPLRLEVLAHAAAGDVARVERLLQEKDPKKTQRWGIYGDADLGPLMRSAKFAKVREKYPEPERVLVDDEDE